MKKLEEEIKEAVTQKTYHFGYQQVTANEKAANVNAVFTRVSEGYDLMNDLMSFGLHRYWKAYALDRCLVHRGETVCDLAGGTADLTLPLAGKVGDKGQVYLVDMNQSMIQQGRDKLLNRGIYQQVHYVVADGTSLPFLNNSLDCIVIAFGLRNFVDIKAGLVSMYRVLKPGGRLVILEFSKPTLPLLKTIYKQYSLHWLPMLGKLIMNDDASYRYLAESIDMHPDQETLCHMLAQAGYEDVNYENLTHGIVALHKAFKY